jgi:hypothetical protein
MRQNDSTAPRTASRGHRDRPLGSPRQRRGHAREAGCDGAQHRGRRRRRRRARIGGGCGRVD